MTNTTLKAKLATDAEAALAAADDITTKAAKRLEGLRAAASKTANAGRDRLVDMADGLSVQLETEADETKGLQAQMLDGLAKGVATASDSLRGRTLGDLLAGAQDYARRNPATVAVGAAVAGFVLARVIHLAAAPRQGAEMRELSSAPKAPRG